MVVLAVIAGVLVIVVLIVATVAGVNKPRNGQISVPRRPKGSLRPVIKPGPVHDLGTALISTGEHEITRREEDVVYELERFIEESGRDDYVVTCIVNPKNAVIKVHKRGRDPVTLHRFRIARTDSTSWIAYNVTEAKQFLFRDWARASKAQGE